MTKKAKQDARQSEAKRLSKQKSRIKRQLERKPRESEAALYKVIQDKGDEGFHLYQLQKESDQLSQTTVHRTLVKLYDLGLLEKERISVGARPKDLYRLNKQGKEFLRKRIEVYEFEKGIET